ncbi:MAG: sigma-70 family RNA polymerase sigma factor [Verrucomicrobiales bacterium]|nr:sigma-70 family RNA polymerase sigma factor [Verrucomicrobiales bacterium]
MPDNAPAIRGNADTHAVFQPTHWSVVIAAGRSSSPEASKALETLCHDYWYPIYAFIRRRGYSPHDAQDLAQGFFEHLFEREWLGKVSPEKGRFRTYLLHCLSNFLVNDWNKQRGPERRPVGGILPLEIEDAEGRYSHEPVDNATPEKLFQRRWVAALIQKVKVRLRAECVETGKLSLFEKVESQLGDRMDCGSIAAIAEGLEMNEGALRVAIHRLRQRFGELLREAVGETVGNPAEVEAEIRSLFTAWT